MPACPTCGRELPGDFPFCPFCGAALTAADAERAHEERKVVTLLFCDLVGFTTRSERLDPEDVRALLAPYHVRVRAELERFGGTVEKFIGDAVVAVFGVPVAHEDDPERAVRSALAIRDWAREEGIELRIGVNTGEALVTVGGEPLAAGDVVNTAARLQTSAPTDGILVGEVTHRATRDAIAYAEHRAVLAKGKAEPVRAWLAERATAQVKVEREARAPLVGRGREISLLRETLDRVRGGRESQLVTLVGVPGIGKSRLVYELFRVVEEEPDFVSWRRGRSLPYGEGVTFWALGEIVKAQADILETDGAEQVEAKLRAAVAATATAGGDDPEWLEGHLRPLVGLETIAIGADRRTEAFAAWRRFLESLADRHPLVLVFEDLHWADDAMLDFVDHVVDWATGVPLLVIGTARPELLERRPGWGGGKPNATTLSLSPLSDGEAAELVHALLESPVLAAEAQAELLARAGGNPLYAEEFARLVAEGRPPDDLPEGVQGVIAARLDALSAEEKALLQDAAVVGKVFWLGAISEIAGIPRWTAEERLHTLERKEFVRRERRSAVAGEQEHTFRHVLVRDVAYGQIPRAERARKHRLAAEWIESFGRAEDHAEMLAHHYSSALELARASGGDDASLRRRTRSVAVVAGDRASSLNAFPAAARFYDQALDLMDADDPDRLELLFALGRALHLTGDERCRRVLEDAAAGLATAGRTERAAEAHVLLGEMWWDRGQGERADEQLGRALELAGAGESRARALALARIARTQMVAGAYEAALESGRQALPIIERLDIDDLHEHVLATVGSARAGLGDAGGIVDLERSIEIGLANDSPTVATSYNNLGVYHLYAGDVRRDEELRQDSLRMSKRFGDARHVRFLRGVLVEHSYWQGRWDEALGEADAFIAECESHSAHYLEPGVRALRALIHLARDASDAATEDVLRAQELAEKTRDPQMLVPAIVTRLRVDFELGRLEDAAAAAGRLLERPPDMQWLAPGSELAWTAERLGHVDAARRWVQGIRLQSKWSDAALAILDGDLERAADLFAEIGSLPDEARARLRAGDPGNIARALDFYRSVRATRYLREGTELQAATG